MLNQIEMNPSPVFDICHFSGGNCLTSKLDPSESREKRISQNIYSMIENADCKRLDRTITCQHQGVFMFHICIRSLVANKKNEKNHFMFSNFCFTKLKFFGRETKGAIA